MLLDNLLESGDTKSSKTKKTNAAYCKMRETLRIIWHDTWPAFLFGGLIITNCFTPFFSCGCGNAFVEFIMKQVILITIETILILIAMKIKNWVVSVKDRVERKTKFYSYESH